MDEQTLRRLEVLNAGDSVCIHAVEDTPRNEIPENSVGDLMKLKTDTGPIQKDNLPKDTERHSASRTTSEMMTEQSEESSSGEDDGEDEKQSAPIELLAEFIKAVMDEEYELAWKLCQMILLYEPENLEAKEFSPLIQKMLQNDEEQDRDEEVSEDSEDTDEEEDEDSSNNDSESSSDETPETSSEDEIDD